jgi:uncharacterized membrane protein
MSDQQGDLTPPADAQNPLTPVIQAVLEKGEPAEQAAAEIATITAVIQSHVGPLPHPVTLEQYARVIPNGGDRFMSLWEREALHRHQQEDRESQQKYRLASDGQRIGALLTLLLIAAATYLGATGHQWLGGTMATTTIAAVMIVFVLRRRPEKGSAAADKRQDEDESDDDDDDDDDDDSGDENSTDRTAEQQIKIQAHSGPG